MKNRYACAYMYLRLALQASAGLKKYWDSPPFHVGICIYLLQYISFYFNLNIAIFVGFQIAVYAYFCAAYFYIHKPKLPELTPSGRLVITRS